MALGEGEGGEWWGRVGGREETLPMGTPRRYLPVRSRIGRRSAHLLAVSWRRPGSSSMCSQLDTLTWNLRRAEQRRVDVRARVQHPARRSSGNLSPERRGRDGTFLL